MPPSRNSCPLSGGGTVTPDLRCTNDALPQCCRYPSLQPLCLQMDAGFTVSPCSCCCSLRRCFSRAAQRMERAPPEQSRHQVPTLDGLPQALRVCRPLDPALRLTRFVAPGSSALAS